MANKFLDKTGLEHLAQKIKALINTKADKTHTHDGRYYTEEEINTKLKSKSDTNHSHMIKATLDLTNLDINTFYPVVGEELPADGFRHIKLDVQLNSGTTPSWSTHARGFTVIIDLLVTACGWGITSAESICLDNSYGFAEKNPAGYYQLNNSSRPVFWLRGGGKYFIFSDYDAKWDIKTSSYTVVKQTISPTTENPGLQITYSTIYANLNGTASGAHSVDGVHFHPGDTSGAFNGDGYLYGFQGGNDYNAYVIPTTQLNANTSNVSAKLGRSGDKTIPMTFNWNGQNGQPSWLWGGNDGENMYVYDPSNFVVHYADGSNYSGKVSITGFGENGLTFYQTDQSFDGNSGWCNYLIANHGNGETYYHYTIGLPFWGTPIYKRQLGNKDSHSGWQRFYTTENITYGTWALTPGQSSLATGNIYLQYE